EDGLRVHRKEPRGRPHLLHQRPLEDANALSRLGHYEEPRCDLRGNPLLVDPTPASRVTRIAIVNRFFPPDPAITGQSARELADFLRSRLPEARVRVYAT